MRHQGGELSSQDVENDRHGGSLEGSPEGRKPLPEVLGTRGGDDDMRPRGIGLGCSDGNKGRGDQRGDTNANEDAAENAPHKAQEEVGGEATEQRPPAGDGVDGAVGAAKGRRDGGGLGDSGGVGRGEAVFGNGLAILVQRDGIIGRRRGVLDDGEGRVDVFEGVSDLCPVSRRDDLDGPMGGWSHAEGC